MSANESLGRAQELAERLRAKLDALERLAEAGDVDAAVDDLAEIAELAKQIEAEVQRARASADRGGSSRRPTRDGATSGSAVRVSMNACGSTRSG